MANGVENPTRGTRVVPLPARKRVPWTGHWGSRDWTGRLVRSGIAGLGGTMNETGGIRVRRDAGDWVRTRVRTSGLVVVALLAGLLGLVVGIGLAGFVGWRLVALPVMCLVAAVVLLVRRYERGGFSRLLKGAAAERNVGGSIEYAITARGCAVAHSVTEIARIGDIDHLVATPNRLWVVETKYRMVPRDRFSEVLRRIRVNLEAVRRWAPPGVEVRGCLVLTTGKDLPRKRLYEDGQVEVFDPKSLVRKLKEESAKQAGNEDVLTARRVWKLAGGESA